MTSSSHATATRSEPTVEGHTGRDPVATIGCSLPTRFVAGLSAVGGLEQDWLDMYGTRDACLERLRDLGVTSIELRDVRAQIDPDDVVRALDAVRDAAMRISLHLWLPRAPEELRSLVAEIDRVLAPNGAQVRCVVHPHATEADRDRREATRSTAASLDALCAWLLERGSPLHVALELCRHKPGGPVATTYGELVEIRDRVGRPNLGLCWDVGHALWNHANHGFDLMPRADFVAAVAHTHIHDLDGRGRTHGPLTTADGAVADALRMLARSGYGGVYDLELEPSRWGMRPDAARDAVEGSVGVLRAMLEGDA